ncbi:LacI family DNA-binding transcriptional regulator [Aquibacillus albus]|nr:substrate-binding domain-containing protein [Aquibacillus albus]
MKRVTMADVAEKANVSKSTVSQYLNNRFDYMSKQTRDRIKIAIEELGYQPNFVARSLKQKSTSTIGVIVANILHTFSTQVLRAIEDYFNEHGFHAIVCNSYNDPVKELRYLEMLRAKQVDGLIVVPTGGNLDVYQRMIDEQFPLVFMDRIVEELRVDSILLDNEAASFIAVQHLKEKGYYRLGILTSSLKGNITPRIERVKSFRKALQMFNLPIYEDFIQGYEQNEYQFRLKELLSLPQPPEALLAGNDFSLMEILQFVKDHRIVIPEQLAVISVDEVSFADIYSPGLTTINQPTFEMGTQAAEMLWKKIKKEHNQSTNIIHRFKPELVVRDSC